MMKNPHLLSLTVLSLSLAILFSSCKKEQPVAPPPPEPDVKVSPNARPIDSTVSQQLLSISSDGYTFTFSSGATSILSLRPNDIVIMQRDQGYLRKVISVEQTANNIVVQTGDAVLTDAIEKATFVDSGALTPANAKSVTNLLEGVLLKTSTLNPNAFVFQIDSVVIYDQDGNLNTTNDQIRANGALQVNLSRRFEVSIENWQLRRLLFTYSAEEDVDLEITTGISFSVSRDVEIASITFATITIWIVPPPPLPPIPVYITPRLSVFVGIDGNAAASFSAGVTQQANFTASIRYENSAWHNSQSLTNNFSFSPPTLSSTIEAKGFAGTSLELLLYGSLAPRATADAYLRLAANPTATPWWNLYGGLEAGLGVSLRILGHNLVDYSVPDLIAHERLLGSATTPPSGNVWTQKTDFGGIARNVAVGFSIGNKGYIGTGQVSPSARRDFWEYDPSSNTWTQKADFGGTARNGAVGFSIGTQGYIGTGFDGSERKDFWAYDPSSNTWTRKADFGGTARHGAVGFSIGVRGYIGTGSSGAPGNFPTLKDFWEYDPSSNTWTQRADFGGTARLGGIGFSVGNKGYIGTGLDSTSTRRDIWEYDPSSNTWTQKANFGGAARWSSVGFSIGTRGYIGTGSSPISRDFWEYDPSSNTWTQEADFGGTARYGAVGFSIGTTGYVGTGSEAPGAGSLVRDFWQYEPEQ
jgi:N-acetylneuraminic acid mutarotase